VGEAKRSEAECVVKALSGGAEEVVHVAQRHLPLKLKDGRVYLSWRSGLPEKGCWEGGGGERFKRMKGS
jgi:hypothetical protein